MSSLEKSLLVGIGIVGVVTLCCLGAIFGAAVANNGEQGGRTAVTNLTQQERTAVTSPIQQEQAIVAQPTTTPTAMAAPTFPASDLPNISPDNTNLTALTAYAEEIKPILEEGLTAAERDGQIVEQGKNNPAALCDGNQVAHPTFVADAALMAQLKTSLQNIDAPAETAVQVHKPLTDSITLWGEALGNLNKSCETAVAAERDLLRLGASLQLGAAIINFHVASDNFWRLIVVYGLEAIVGSAP
ncbi:hypothetical protein MNBD_CHLOROFLEXI01-311 [hydrothermal vent metagenome]|uniref:Uncharacterized protein n=1 Tax=hydrothermal vent metagenome TaxID=652676 RepID=A0A3B0UQU9_9ZZZZ